MARIKSKRNALKTLSCKFGGIGKHTPLDPLGAEDMCNFRILPNGTLKVRPGYVCKKQFAQGRKIRGVWEGVLGGISIHLAVVDNKVYRWVGSQMNEIDAGTITDNQENVHFCVYENTLYLLDGEKIWTYVPSSTKFVELEPYVPLYGYQWHPQAYGEVNEDINLLTTRMRVHYYNSGDYNVFILPYYASSVDIVHVNGKKTTEYSFSAHSNKVTFTSSTPPITVEIGFTVTLNEEIRAEILAAQMAYIYSRNGQNQLMLWGNSGNLYRAQNVTNPMLSSCRVFYPKASPLYFRSNDVFFLGDHTHPITSISPLHDSLLAFTSDRIWSISFDEEGMHTTLATHDMGCASPHGAIPYKNGILAAMNGGIYKITASSSQTDELSIERVSGRVDDKFPADFTQKAHLIHHYADGEIWMRDPTDSTGTVWIWNTENGEWYRYGDINAGFFFKGLGGFGFATENEICLFDRSVSTDNGSAIDAYYQSSYLDMGASDSVKRSMRALLYAAPNKSKSQMLFETEQGKLSYSISTPSYAKSPQLWDMRMRTHRYRFLRFTLSTAASNPAEFYRLDIYSQP